MLPSFSKLLMFIFIGVDVRSLLCPKRLFDERKYFCGQYFFSSGLSCSFSGLWGGGGGGGIWKPFQVVDHPEICRIKQHEFF